jgi:transaldolase
MKKISNLEVKLFADGADLAEMLEMYEKPHIKGLTTNPTLMRKAGITDYRSFAQEVLSHVTAKPISFEVFSDDLAEMERQALEISTWGTNVYVKIPITNTQGISTERIVGNLVKEEVKVNVTALMTTEQVTRISKVLGDSVPSYVSVFAGRIADTGRDPLKIMSESLRILTENTSTELIWASPRELLNVFQANEIGCHVITATNDILKKLELVGYDLNSYSLDTVKMFRNDALSAGYSI